MLLLNGWMQMAIVQLFPCFGEDPCEEGAAPRFMMAVGWPILYFFFACALIIFSKRKNEPRNVELVRRQEHFVDRSTSYTQRMCVIAGVLSLIGFLSNGIPKGKQWNLMNVRGRRGKTMKSMKQKK